MRAARTVLDHPVALTAAVAAGLQVLWLLFLADAGGDIAAQDAWAEFAREHPGRTYNFAWYGGIHSASYSVLSPYIMAVAGVRSTLIVAATASATLLAWLVVRSGAVRQPWLPGLLGALAMFANSISGRTTFILGMPFALAALLVVCARPEGSRDTGWRRWGRGGLTALFALAATLASPVDGLFLGLIAAGLWLTGRHGAAYTLGIPPVLVVVLAAIFFPLDGVQPMPWSSTILPIAIGMLVFLTAPTQWRLVRTTAVVYVVAVVVVWVIPTPIGTNVTRLALLFAPALFAAICLSGKARSPLSRVPVLALVTLMLVGSLTWQTAGAVRDGIRTTPDEAWEHGAAGVAVRLQALGADDARIEVVPTASHREVSAFSPQFVLARGWNRQLDTRLNERFYDEEDPLTSAEYHAWLRHWAVSYVVVPPGRPDEGALSEHDVIEDDPAYLRMVWADDDWAIYAVQGRTSGIGGGGRVYAWTPGGMTVWVPDAGSYLIREKYSDRMVLRDSAGQPLPAPETLADNEHGCLQAEPAPEGPPDDPDGDESDDPDDPDDSDEADTGWTVLRAPRTGIYRISSDVAGGTGCPEV